MNRLPGKLFLSLFILSSLLFFLFITPATIQAATDNPMNIFDQSLQQMIQQEKDIRQNADKDQTVFIYNVATEKATADALPYAWLGKITCLDRELCQDKATVMNSLAQVMGTMYGHPPASAIAYTQDLLANAGFIKPAYAQGIGFAALTPFLPLWKATRDIAYMLLIIVMVAIGFMIIFRMKIDPKTVISVQAALPKIVLTLIIITLSYPIVGFLIDIMYLVMAIAISIFVNSLEGKQLSGYGADVWQTDMMTGGSWTLLRTIFAGGAWAPVEFAEKFWGLEVTTGVIGGGVAAWGAFFTSLSAMWGFGLGLGAPVAILALILALGLLFVFIRLLMLLANSYIQLIISLILGPILLLNEAIPGRSAFKEWILNIMANLSVFPATALILMFATYLVSAGVGGQWTPPFIGLPGNVGQGFFSAFMGLSMIFLAPNLVVAVKKMFQPKPALPITAGTMLSPLTGATQTAMGATQQFYYGQMAFGSVGKWFGMGGTPQPGAGGGPKH